LLKPPKEKWEGAQQRNHYSKTNILFPIFNYVNLKSYEQEESNNNNLILSIES